MAGVDLLEIFVTVQFIQTIKAIKGVGEYACICFFITAR